MLARLPVPADGVLVFVIETATDTPTGSYIIRVRIDPVTLASSTERIRRITLAADAPQHSARPAQAPVVPLQITRRSYLPLIVRQP